jgi:hypothetical protein
MEEIKEYIFLPPFCHLSACGHDNCFPGLLDGSIWNLVTELLRTLTIGWWDAW